MGASYLQPEPLGEQRACAVAVIYEDSAARNEAIQLCARLMRAFEQELEFDFTWWRFKFLLDPEIAQLAAAAAAGADLILVAVHRAESFPLEVESWFERWPAQRKLSEGALVLIHSAGGNESQTGLSDAYLRLVAQRARLDYLPPSGTGWSHQLRDRVAEPSKTAGTAG